MSVDQVVAQVTRHGALRRFTGDRAAVAAGVVLLTIVAAILLAPLVAPSGPEEIVGASARGPSAAHWLGTDEIGRDVLSRLLYGGRVSLGVGLAAATIAALIGIPWGLVSGYLGGLADTTSMRLTDGLLAFPPVVLALAIVAALGTSVVDVVVAIGVILSPLLMRIARAEALAICQRDYVASARAIGASHTRILRHSVLPNATGPLTVQFTLCFATAILAEASLSFLGLGVQPPTASWGSMLDSARGYLDYNPFYGVAVGAAITLCVLCVSVLGDALADATDPRARS